MLTLKMIGLNDYSVREDKRDIGRIRFAHERAPGIWLWHITVILLGVPLFGDAKTLDEAKDRFSRAWDEIKATVEPEALARAFAAMDHANRPDRYQR